MAHCAILIFHSHQCRVLLTEFPGLLAALSLTPSLPTQACLQGLIQQPGRGKRPWPPPPRGSGDTDEVEGFKRPGVCLKGETSRQVLTATDSWRLGQILLRREHEACCCCSLTQSCLSRSDPTDRSTPGFLVLHCLPEFVQIHIH